MTRLAVFLIDSIFAEPFVPECYYSIDVKRLYSLRLVFLLAFFEGRSTMLVARWLCPGENISFMFLSLLCSSKDLVFKA